MCESRRQLFPVTCNHCRRTLDGLLASAGAEVLCPTCSRAVKVDSSEKVGGRCDGNYC